MIALMRKILGVLSIAAFIATALVLLWVSFSTYVLADFAVAEPGWYWGVWLNCFGLFVGVCLPLLAIIFWCFRTPREMYLRWLLRILGAAMIVSSLIGFMDVGLSFATSGWTPLERWSLRILAPSAALLALGTWTLASTRAALPRKTAAPDEAHSKRA